MSDFIRGTLNDLVSRVVGGGTPSRGNPEYWKGELPWASVKDISASPRFLLDTEEHISADGLRLSAANSIPANVLLVATRMAVGATTLTVKNTAINQDLKAIFPRDSVDTGFLRYLLLASNEHLKKHSIGSTVKGISVKTLLDTPVQYPSDIVEQQGIAEVLSALDEKIEQTEALVEKFSVIRAGLVRDLLTELAAAPREPLKNLAKVGSGVTLGRTFTGPSTAEYSYLRVANVQDGQIDLTEVKTIRIPVVNASRAMLQVGDVLMNEGGDFDKLGRGAVWTGQIPNCLHQNHVFRVRCDQEKLLPGFLSLWAASDFGKRFFILASKQSTNLASINSTQLKSFPVLKPSVTEQQTLLDAVSKIDAIQDANKAEVAKLYLQKQGLMRDLLTGAIRVS